jgi:hypothetical protein
MSQTFEALYGGVISTDPTLVIGTVQVGSLYGQCKTASIKRGGDKKEVKNDRGGIRAVLMTGINTQLSMKCIFDSASNLPNIGQPVQIPLMELTGLLEGVDVEWEEDGERMLTLTVGAWDSLNVTQVFHWNGSTGGTGAGGSPAWTTLFD